VISLRKGRAVAVLVVTIAMGLFLLGCLGESTEAGQLVESLRQAERPLPEQEILNFLATYTADAGGCLVSEVVLPEQRGKYALAETQGQLLEYAVAVEAEALFAEAFLGLEKFILADGTVAWRYDIAGKRPAETSALVDDLRIGRSLLLAGEVFSRREYEVRGSQILKTVSRYNKGNSFCADFAGKAAVADRLSLFYIDPVALQGEEQQLFNDTVSILLDAPVRGPGFFPAYYCFRTEGYVFLDKVNFVEQLYTARFAWQAGRHSTSFVEFISQELEAGRVLYNYYDYRGRPVGTDTSVAVYALAASFLLETGLPEMAELCFGQLEAWRHSPGPGMAYFSAVEGEAFTFDQMEVLLALQKRGGMNDAR
jgi:hypothetical protein